MIKSTFAFDFPISEGRTIARSEFATAPKVVEGVLHDLPEAEEGTDLLVNAFVFAAAPADRLDLIMSDNDLAVRVDGKVVTHVGFIRKDGTKGLF